MSDTDLEFGYGEPEVIGDPGRVDRVREALKVWKGQLVDFGARNTLLFYRDLKQGTLDLSAESPVQQAVVDQLLGGRQIRLSQRFVTEEELSRAAKRARVIRARAREHYEEKGLVTLHCAWGMATWSHPRGQATPAAPILLRTLALTSEGVGDDFALQLTGELEVNPTFVEYLRAEFGISLSGDELDALVDPDVPGVPDPRPLFAHLSKAARDVPGFAINERVVIGTFSYAKLPMVRDLEANLEALVDHDLVAAIAGDRTAQDALRQRAVPVDPCAPNRIAPSDEFLVLDADSSQNHAINNVLAGRHLVIKGPPGTGKSQTIANLAATLMARGKTVLFVAEKRAAIDAVLRRLSHVGLGDMVLDLHDGAGSKRQMAAKLQQSLQQAANQTRPQLEDVHSKLLEYREELLGYDRALHQSREPWGISMFEVQSRLIGLSPAATTRLRLSDEDLRSLDTEGWAEAANELRRFVLQGGTELGSNPSPWAKANLVSGEDAQSAVNSARRCLQLIPLASEALEAVRRQCGFEAPANVAAWTSLLNLLKRAGAALQRFSPDVFTLPLDDLLVDLAPATRGGLRRGWAKLMSSKYRQAEKTLRLHWTGQTPRPVELHETAAEAAGIATLWAEHAVEGSRPQRVEFAAALQIYRELLNEIEALGPRLPNLDLASMSMQDLEDLCGRLSADAATAAKIPELRRLESSLSRRGLGPLLDELRHGAVEAELCGERLEYLWLASIRETVAFADPAIGAFDGRLRHAAAQAFADLDSRHVATTPSRVRRACAEHLIRTREEFPEEDHLVRAEAAKKSRHLGLRQLFQIAPHVLGALKPCWAMSPLVVAQLLPGDRPYFDVVIFDEASQIPPAEAIPAVARGRQVVVAGDDRQLPPTAFFVPTTDQEEDDPDAAAASLTAGFESILDALSPLLDFRMLQWHYRSRDERLIAFSNHHLYDRALTTFPGVAGGKCLRHELVSWEGTPSEESSSAEVRRVVDLILEHARQRPNESLGVIAMGIKHAERIAETLRLARRDHPELEDFFAEGGDEPFFVKNLERVQGDERDAIILTVGYGKNANGDLPHRFGPLLLQGGERRLNVAVTRAKNRMTVVSAFSADEVDPRRTKAKGADLLRLYLAYAQSGGKDLGPTAPNHSPLNPFEISVRDALTRAGIPVHAQFGASGYYIDFAAGHPTRPGRMVLAIECDGARYHSSATARDRDRLRQDKLEDLGWRFHRIWSTDWFLNQAAEVDRVVAAYRGAVDAVEAERKGSSRSAPSVRRPSNDKAPGPAGPTTADEHPPTTRGAKPSVPKGYSISEYANRQLVALARWVESDTLPRTVDEVVDILMTELGFQRRGKKIVQRLSSAVATARRTLPAPAARPPSQETVRAAPAAHSERRDTTQRHSGATAALPTTRAGSRTRGTSRHRHPDHTERPSRTNPTGTATRQARGQATKKAPPTVAVVEPCASCGHPVTFNGRCGCS